MLLVFFLKKQNVRIIICQTGTNDKTKIFLNLFLRIKSINLALRTAKEKLARIKIRVEMPLPEKINPKLFFKNDERGFWMEIIIDNKIVKVKKFVFLSVFFLMKR